MNTKFFKNFEIMFEGYINLCKMGTCWMATKEVYLFESDFIEKCNLSSHFRLFSFKVNSTFYIMFLGNVSDL